MWEEECQRRGGVKFTLLYSRATEIAVPRKRPEDFCAQVFQGFTFPAFPSVIFINNYQHAINCSIMLQPSPNQAFLSISSRIIYLKVKRKTAPGNMIATLSLLDILHHKYQQPLRQSFYQILGLYISDWRFHKSVK